MNVPPKVTSRNVRGLPIRPRQEPAAEPELKQQVSEPEPEQQNPIAADGDASVLGAAPAEQQPAEAAGAVDEHTVQPPTQQAEQALRAGIRKRSESHVSQRPSAGIVKKETRSVARRIPVDLDKLDVTGESLPVLEAFQSFVDTERRRARRSLFAVSFLFLLIIGGALAGSFFAGKMAYDRLQRELEGGRDELRTTKAELDTIRGDLSGKTRELGDQIIDTSRKFDAARAGVKDLDSRLKTALEDVASLKSGYVTIKTENAEAASGMEAELMKIVKCLETLTEENAVLRDELEELYEVPDYAAASGTQPPDDSLSMLVAPSNAEQKVNWRLPLPWF